MGDSGSVQSLSFVVWYAVVVCVAFRTGSALARSSGLHRRRAASIAGLVLLLVVTTPLAALCVWLSFERLGYPYNSEGRYFDGRVVYHDSAPLGYGLVGGALSFATAAGAGALLRLQRTRDHEVDRPAA